VRVCDSDYVLVFNKIPAKLHSATAIKLVTKIYLNIWKNGLNVDNKDCAKNIGIPFHP